ncbi:MAG: amidohydrolase family protein, partial [Actinomycetales bacterium]|nr:amidohydrolase family protein [Actinomycetales bacterium]
MTGTMMLRGARLVRIGEGGVRARTMSDDDAPGLGEHADDATANGLLDVAIADGRITAVGPRLETRGDEEIDLEGRWLMPGLWDAHVHMTQWALDRQRVDVSHAQSAAEAAATMAQHARTTPPPPDVVLVGRGLRDALWPDVPTSALLDAALEKEGVPPTTAVVVVSGDLHSAWFNTRALTLLGASGHPTGFMKETDWMGRMGAIDVVPTDVLDRWVDEAAREAASRGVVGIVDFEIADNLAAWTRRIQAGTRSLRVDAGVWREHLDRPIGLEIATGDVILDTGGLLRLGPFKIITDGSLNSRTAYCADPYPGMHGAGAYGVLNTPTEELTALLRHVRSKGITAAVHAIGDRANTLALDAYAVSGARGSIEHAQLLSDDDVARLATLDVVASVQPEHAMDDRDVADRHWAGRTGGAFAFGSLARAGVRMAFGSDAPVAPLDPWA